VENLVKSQGPLTLTNHKKYKLPINYFRFVKIELEAKAPDLISGAFAFNSIATRYKPNPNQFKILHN